MGVGRLQMRTRYFRYCHRLDAVTISTKGGNLMEIEKLKNRLLEWDGVDTVDNGEFTEVNYHGVFDLLREAADALEQFQAENNRLGAKLEKEEAARKKQADILYELRGQKYELTTAIDQLRAENDRFKRERVRQIPVEEPLTCEGCLHEVSGHENCNYCIRAGYLGDYYCRSQEVYKNE